MSKFVRRYLLWFAYAAFLIIALRFGSREGLFEAGDRLPVGKYLTLLVFLCFVAYSLYATHKENFFRSVGVINRLWWGRQIGLDLYISVFLSLALIYLVEGSVSVMLLWLIPVLFFANLAILPYILINFQEIVTRLLG